MNTDAVEALLKELVILPPELLAQVESFMEENKHMGYTTREEFVRDSIRFRLSWLKGEYEYVEIPKEQYEKLQEAVKEMRTPYSSTEDFISNQIREALEKYEEWKQTVKPGV